MKNYRDGGEAILEAFRALDIDYVVSSPGSEWAPMWEALSRQAVSGRQGPQYIQCWDETLALNIATGYTMMTGRAQAVLLHAGAGTLHGTLGLYGALRAEVPMIVLSGESITLGEDANRTVEPQWYAGVSVGGVDRLVAPLTKMAGQVRSAATLYRTIIRAGEIAVRTPKGPVHLDVPLEYMLEPWEPPADRRRVAKAPKQFALTEDIQRLAEALIAAKNPMIVVEHAGIDPAAFTALVALAEALAIPVIGAPGASCANFPTAHPMWLGVGSYGYLEYADLVVLIGARTPWYPPSKRYTSGRIVAIHDHPLKTWLVYQNTQVDEYLEGDIVETLVRLTKSIENAAFSGRVIVDRRKKWTAESAARTKALLAHQEQAKARDNLTVPAICAAINATMPRDTIYVEETITHAGPLRQHLALTRPLSFFRHNGGGLGQGIGIALGVKLAARRQPVVLFVGDGSFLYNPIIQAFGASKDHDLPILVIVLNNGGYRSMGDGHRLYYPDGAAANTGFQIGVKIDSPAFERLGDTFQFFGACAKTPAEFGVALDAALEALKSGRSAIINAMVLDGNGSNDRDH
jgi:acetolactate synthase-1/2/3 large subunit